MRYAFIVLAFLAAVAALADSNLAGVDSYAIGKNAGYRGSANRTVLIGPGAGAYISNADSNVVIGAAAALDGSDIYSSIAFGHYAMRGASGLRDVVAIGDQAAKSASGVKDSVLIGKNCGNAASDVTNAVTIGNNLSPANNTVNIGGRILCDDDGLVVNGNLIDGSYGSQGEMSFVVIETNAYRSESYHYVPGEYNMSTVSGYFYIDYYMTVSNGEFIGWSKAILTLIGTCDGETKTNSATLVEAQNGGCLSQFPDSYYDGFDFSLRIHWSPSYTYTGNGIEHEASVNLDVIINNTNSGRVNLGLCYCGPIENNGNQYLNQNGQDFEISMPKLPSYNIKKVVDTYPNRNSNRHFITSSGVANAIDDRVSNCSIKYEDGVLRAYDLNGNLIGTLSTY